LALKLQLSTQKNSEKKIKRCAATKSFQAAWINFLSTEISLIVWETFVGAICALLSTFCSHFTNSEI